MSLMKLLKGTGYLPTYVLNHSPAVLVAYDHDFFNHMSEFRAVLPKDKPFTLILQIGYSLQAPGVKEPFANYLQEARNLFPEGRFVVLYNEPEERDCLPPEVEALFCTQNAFLNPRAYALATKRNRPYDAIYVARFTACKRHALAVNVKRLRLIGYVGFQEREYTQKTLKTLGHADWTLEVPAYRMAREMGQAYCGLALSDVEGAMFVCAEYSLCGLPVVNTPNIGGRNVLLPDFAQVTVEPTVDAVTEGVNHWLEHPVPPQDVRDAFIKAAQPHRERLLEFIESVTGRRVALPHKLGVRRGLWPHQRWLHGIRKPTR